MTNPFPPYLDPDERLLWTGTPAQGLRFTPKRIFASLGGLFLLSFALLWTAGAGGGLWTGAWRTADGFFLWFLILFPLFGLPFVALGLYTTIGHFFHDAHTRARTRYALTSRRALIMVDGREPKLKSFPIRPETIVDFQQGPEATLQFATESSKDSDGDWTHTRVGFELIPDGDHVYRLIRHIQTGTA